MVLAITLQTVYLYLGVFFGGLGLFILGWYQNPYNAATVLRSVTKKPHAVIGIVYPAGQIQYFVRKWAQPSFNINNKIYTPDQRLVKYVKSIPVCFFNSEDCLQLNIDAPETNDAKRSPEQIEAAYMITKGIYEAKAQKKIQKLELMMMGCLVLCLIIILFLYVIHTQITTLGYTISGVQTSLNTSISSLPNLIN